MTQSLGTTMKQQLLFAVSAVFFSSSAFANGGFEPNPKACVNVGKEINRVSTEMKVAKSGIQKSWLKRQLGALESKRSHCSTKGFSTR